MIAVFKKELKTYFCTPLGYVFLAVFFVLFGLIFYDNLFLNSANYGTLARFEYVIANCLISFIFLTPILTMRMFADERNKGTDELLFTSPRSIVGIVFGKFLAAMVVIFIAILLMIPYYIIINKFSSPSLSVSLVAILGFIFIAMSYISFGMFASSITSNQFSSALLTIGFFIITSMFYSSKGVMATVSLYNMYQKFPLGIISLQEVIGFLSFTILFLLLTMIILQRRKSKQ